MGMKSLHSLTEVFGEVPDPREKRGVRHPFSGILSLVFLGLLARIREPARLQFWAQTHWDELREPLGFERAQPPHATTISRCLAKFSVAAFQESFSHWLLSVVEDPDDLSIVAADAKTSCQGHDADGRPVQMLSIFAHRAKLVLTQWSVHAEKTNEPVVLRNHVHELLSEFPMLRLLTGDAIYTQRSLAELLASNECDYLLQVKKNQGDLYEAFESCFADADARDADARTVEKKGGDARLVACGVISTMPTTAESGWGSPAAASPFAWSVWSQPSTGRPLVVM